MSKQGKHAEVHASQPQVLSTGRIAMQSLGANGIGSSGFGKGYSFAVLLVPVELRPPLHPLG